MCVSRLRRTHKWRSETVALKAGPIQNGTELGAPGDEEYNKSPWREGSPRLLREEFQIVQESNLGLPSLQGGLIILLVTNTLSLYYEGRVKGTIFSRNFVYVLRTTIARHMVSSIDFYFHFLSSFLT